MLKKMATLLCAAVLAAVVGVGSASATPVFYSSPLDNGAGYGTIPALAPGAGISLNIWFNPAANPSGGSNGAFDWSYSAIGAGTSLTGFTPTGIVGGSLTVGALSPSSISGQLGNSVSSPWTTPFKIGTLVVTGALGGSIETTGSSAVVLGGDNVSYFPITGGIVTFVPEPGTLMLLGAGLAGLVVQGRRREN